jgi:hypothetical protein
VEICRFGKILLEIEFKMAKKDDAQRKCASYLLARAVPEKTAHRAVATRLGLTL